MTMNPEQKLKEDELSATVTLDVLHTLVPDPEQIKQRFVVLMPSPLPVSHEEAIALLMAQPKPLSCIASTFSRALAVGWWVRDSKQERRWIDRRKRLMASILRPYRNIGGTAGEDTRMALLIGDAVTALSFAMCMRWLCEYHFMLAGEGVAPATGRLKALGFAATIRISKSPGSYMDAVAWR
jgi:hypothetical protein